MKTYCFRKCISISHSNNGVRENAHIHTVEIATFIKTDTNDAEFVRFSDIEDLIDTCLDAYQEKYLNDMEGFEENASIEYLGEVLFEKLDTKFVEHNICMTRFEIGETPLRKYILTRTV